MEAKNNQFRYPIVFWGPKGSGKTSLIYAFADIINSKYINHEDGLSYTLWDPITRAKVFAPSPDTISDVRRGSMRYTVTNNSFSREPRNDRKFAPWELQKLKISCHTHHISFCDDSGGKLFELVATDEPNQVDDLESVWVRFKDAKNIVVLLDPSLLDDSEVESDVGAVRYSRDTYLAHVRNLCQRLVKELPLQRRLAVCLTKADRLENGRVMQALANEDSAWRLIKEMFGDDMYRMLKTYSQLDAAPFIVSAKKDRVNRWDPMGVEYPFFWIFEDTETEALLESISDRKTSSNSDFFRVVANWVNRLVYTKYPKR